MRKSFLWCCVLLLAACASGQSAPESALVRREYIASNENFANPERGFYQQEAPMWLGSNKNSLSSSQLATARLEGVSVLRLYFLIDEFVQQAISSEALTFIEAQFSTARNAGMKLIPRFAYNFPQGGTYPYKDPDASLTQVLAHIAQLEPILQKNADVIAFLELGFIGAWGEWHSSTNNLVDSEPNAWINDASKAIVSRLLQALPSRRMVAMRYPPYKQQFYGNLPLTAAEAYNATPKARMGAHNDCFLASKTDWGTYPEDLAAREALKNFLASDNLYLPQGGETCNIGADAQPYVGCENAQSELAKLHYSVLNRGYLEDVNKLWQSQGCLETIKQRLGYRFRLLSSSFPDVVSQKFTVKIELQNDGYATPYNPRGVALVLRRNADGNQTRVILHDGNVSPARTFDPRFWHSGKHLLETTLNLPSGMESGAYTLFLHLFDLEIGLQNRSEYAIRLANQDIWDNNLGMNRLGTLEIR